MKTCAVIISVYQAHAPWLRECLASIRAQVPTPGWSYEVRIGVDGCAETSLILHLLGEDHWVSPVNVGPYVVRNSLIGLQAADAYAIFDADDVMHPGYLLSTLGVAGDGIAGAGRFTMDAHGRVNRTYLCRYQNGVAVFSRRVWETLGGFRPWRVAADHDFIQRAKAAGIPVTKIEAPLYYRRMHAGSLTNSADTVLHGPLRAELKRQGDALIAAGNLFAHPCTTPLTFVKGRSP